MMLKFQGAYKKAQNLPGDAKNLLIEFSTTQGYLPIIISSEQWMKFFVNDETPKPGSRWELTLKVVVIPELGKTMFSLSEAKRATSEEIPEDSIVDLLKKIYSRLDNPKAAAYENSNELLTDSKKSTSVDELESLGNNYHPTIDAVDDNTKVEVNEPRIKDHEFNLNETQKNLSPNKRAVDQGTGDTVTNQFFDHGTDSETEVANNPNKTTNTVDNDNSDFNTINEDAPLDFSSSDDSSSDDLSDGF